MKRGWRQIELGGVVQWVSVLGDEGAPVLLLLHGGPGAPEFGPRRKFLRELEDDWLVVDWEQRGAGRSFRGDEDASTLTFERLVRDCVELVEWLCRELRRARVVLAGHSFGTALGVHVVRRAPARVAAYVGTGQIVNWTLQEERGYDWALAEARRQNKNRAIKALEALGRPKDGSYATGVRGLEIERRWLGTLGGITKEPSFLVPWLLSTATCGDYPLGAKLRTVKAMRRSLELLWPELARTTNFALDATRFDVPVHLFAGRHDHITDVEQIEAWHAALEAPSKRLQIVEAGHLCQFEEPARFREFLAPLRARAQ